MTTAQVGSTVAEVQAIGDTILIIIEGDDPSVALPAAAAQQIFDLTATMVAKALEALTTAQGVAVTASSIATLAPDPTPLTPPTV